MGADEHCKNGSELVQTDGAGAMHFDGGPAAED